MKRMVDPIQPPKGYEHISLAPGSNQPPEAQETDNTIANPQPKSPIVEPASESTRFRWIPWLLLGCLVLVALRRISAYTQAVVNDSSIRKMALPTRHKVPEQQGQRPSRHGFVQCLTLVWAWKRDLGGSQASYS